MALAHTPLDLYRAGNTNGARIDNVRIRDVQMGRNGLVWIVFAGTGGVSLQEAPAGLAGPWYRLPARTAYDDALLLLKSVGRGRWHLEPAHDMWLVSYKAALARLAPEFVRV